jgi:hypothetical protein
MKGRRQMAFTRGWLLCSEREERKVFFFEKKNQKTFDH